ncbi:proline--tRNA ligase [Halorubellus sp. JP-L1]|uniref:aminoacyl--tRNA ligase-related protein n=1 Tax=Halorubellus sp. JP-L1 TaxID=2715753 RepID=UPI001408A850|nr:aminoacyl--tRNA ligase-related protein [Halorubellus sp. JP-L1]NHN42521.1 proline--tRNA ligase [Halorubellus sp. JP-L1]
MRRSDAFLATSREDRGEVREDVRLAVRAGLVRQYGSGLYGFAPTGERVRRKVIDVVAAAMDAIGGQRVSLPQLNYRDRWDESGRWGSFEGEMFALENRDGADMCLAPSHEEGVVHLVDGHVRSYDDLPLLLYQVESKHRDDHARNGLLRTKEFTMKDAYSLHATESGLRETYDRVRGAYERIFDALGLDVAICDADNSIMGGSASEEFVAPVHDGSCALVSFTNADCRFGVTDEHPEFGAYRREDGDGIEECPTCGGALAATDGVEVGHVFQLGTRYADAMDLAVDDGDGESQAVEMGSYGIGVTRVLQTLLAQHADADGCRWPVTDAGTVAPYDVAVVPLSYDGDVRAAADRVHDELETAGVDVLLFDDADQTIGERFAESDLLGVPTKVVLGNHYVDTGEVELETRDGDTRYRDLDTAVAELRD